MNRPTWNKICMDLAKSISQRSTCSNPDRKVGCVITDASHERVLAWGYNGVARGENHQCEYIDNHAQKTKTEEGYTCSCVHAEMNAIAKLNSTDPSDKIMYLTLSPCMICSRLIINAGIKEVYILEIYRDTSPIKLLMDSGIIVWIESDDGKTYLNASSGGPKGDVVSNGTTT